MKYPLIHALSTVGILKHYNQDYLIHDERTDFTGSNGVGKSIIADLFQLIFINDKQLFQFGTEGYRKEARQIHKLPHRCRDAYAFLTIEVTKQKFVCIGVCIPNTTARPLKPFIITSSSDNQLSMEDRSFAVDNIPFAGNFINDKNQVSVIEDLGRHFRDSYGLCFEFYSTREQKDEHYARLYDQQLLPINLSIPSSLKAFAKIIQSFSRARSGGDKSEELKEFLFDGLEKEFEQLFDNHKADIDKLLKDYDVLQKFIEDLEEKQLQLGVLDELLKKQSNAHKDLFLGQCGLSLANSDKAAAAHQSKVNEHRKKQKELERLQMRIPRLLVLSTGYQNIFSAANSRLETLKSCLEDKRNAAQIDKRILGLTFDQLPAISEEFNGKEHIDDYPDTEIIKRFRTFIPVYLQYRSIAAIEQQIALQKELIQNRRQELMEEIEYLELVVRLFNDSSEQSLIAKVVRSDQEISPAQEAVLFHLIKTHWYKPENTDYPYYARGFNFFKEDQIVRDVKLSGYWLNIDDFNIYIPELKNSPVLGNPNLRSNAISELLANNATLIGIAKTELSHLQSFEKGQGHNDVEILKDLDQRLYDYGIANEFAITAQLVKQIDGKIDTLRTEAEGLKQGIDASLRQFGLYGDIDIQSMVSTEDSNLVIWKKKMDNFQDLHNKASANEIAIRENNIPLLIEQATEKEEIAKSTLKVYLEDKEAMEIAFPELAEEAVTEIQENELRNLRQHYDNAVRGYQSQYLSSCKYFRETNSGSNIEIETELAAGKFSFSLLERILLGNKIKFYDQITEELRIANRSRHNLIDSIHETMLKIFMRTKTKYDEYHAQVRDLNIFFKGKTISNKYFFQVNFIPSQDIPIDWITTLQNQSQHLYKPGQLPMGESVDIFVEDFFKNAVGYKKKIAFRDLLDPKSYFTLTAGLRDEKGKEISGSTGETYTAKVLLGIGRLSKVQSQNRTGIRFIILEETANLDKTNFSNFPEIAKEFGYQIITMTPKPFGSDAVSEWYLHHLLPGRHDPDINYPIPASYFKTNTDKVNLFTYLNRKHNELDSAKSTP